MKVLVVSSEAVPFAKTGGLADVAGSLPVYLAKHGVDARLCLPCYAGAAEKAEAPPQPLGDLEVPIGPTPVRGTILQTTTGGGTVPVYLVKHEAYYGRPQLYGHPDDLERYTFLCRSVLHLPDVADWEPDVVHCNDWQTGLIPTYLLVARATAPRTLFTIHNLAYQSPFPRERISTIGFAWGAEGFRLLEMGSSLNLMKGGIVSADFVSTVSPRYAEEIRSPEFGAGLDELLRQRGDRLVGVLNGLDYDEWNPQTDPALTAHYGPDDPSGKAECKRALQEEQGLAPGEAPLIGIVSRLAGQKGLDLIAEVIEEMLGLGVQFVLLGTGDPEYHRLFEHLAAKLPTQIGVNLRFDEPLARRIYAGSDMFLVPSRYEPCGLGQLISLRYGTIPIVRHTGGLADTIRERGPEGNGFVFFDYSADGLLAAVERAIAAYQDRARWQDLVANAFRCDYSWDRAAANYVRLYERVRRAKTVLW